MLEEITDNLAGYAAPDGVGAVTIEKPMAGGPPSKAVILSLQTGRFGNSRKVRQTEVTNLTAYDADGQEQIVLDKTKKSDLVKLTKRLLQSKSLEAITSHDGKTRNTLLKKWCLPSYAADGFYFVPLELVADVDAYLTARANERRDLVDSFVSEYAYLKALAKEESPLYRERDYPSEEQVKARFTWSVRYISLGVAGALREIDAALYQREQDGIEKMWREAGEAIEEALTESLSGLVQHAIERLSFQVNGKPQVFRDSLVENMNEFLGLFDRRNLTSNASLAALVGQARQLMAGVDPNTLRSNIGARERIRTGFQAIQQTMDSMMVDRPVRSIDLDD